MAKRRYGLWALNLVLIAAALYGGFKWYAGYRFAASLDRLADSLEPKASLSYEEIETGLFPSVAHVNRLELRPAQGPSPFLIDRVTVSGPGLVQTLFQNPFASPDRQDLPDRLSVLVEGVHLPMDALLASTESLNSYPAAPAPEDDGGPSARSAPPPDDPLLQSCRPNGVLSAELLRALEIDDPVVDGELRWHVDQPHQELQMGMRFALRGIQSFDMDLVLGGIDSDLLRNRRLSTPPQLVSFELGWRVEPEIAQRFVNLCAARLQQEPGLYRDRLMAGFRTDLEAQGILLGPGMQIALQQFYREWGDVRLSARPDEPVGVLSLVFVPPPQLARRLGAQLEVNNQTYTELDFNFAGPSSADGSPAPGSVFGGGALGALLGGGTTQAKPQRPDTDGLYPEPARIDYRYRWRRVPLSGLRSHLDRSARVHLHDGRVREGLLMQVDPAQIVVEQRLLGGKFTVPVPRTDVAQVEIRLPDPVEPGTTGVGAGSAAQQGSERQ